MAMIQCGKLKVVLDLDYIFFFELKTPYEVRIGDWSSDVCAADLISSIHGWSIPSAVCARWAIRRASCGLLPEKALWAISKLAGDMSSWWSIRKLPIVATRSWRIWRSEEHTSELQSLMRISYAVFCLKKQTKDMNS